jgi:photosystem II stability/assembly factor-like uncharacterized protein/DNA-binding beta-propeller fold protein YncE
MMYWLKTIIPVITFTLWVIMIQCQPISGQNNAPSTDGRLASSAIGSTSPGRQTGAIEIPRVEAIYNLGVPTGNAPIPRYLAVNDQAGQLYILSEGAPEPEPGNRLSIYDIQAGEFIEQVRINQDDNEPLDLQFDPVAGLIYALWQARYDEGAPATLTVVDSHSRQIIQELQGAQAIAAADGRLYAAEAGQITNFEIPGNSLTPIQQVELPPATSGPLAFSPATQRLYLARATDGLWRVDIFEAETLSLAASYQAEGQVLNILPLPESAEVLIVVAQNDLRMLYRITSQGEAADVPYELGPRFGANGIGLSPDGQTLYYSNGQIRAAGGDDSGPALIGLTTTDLTQTGAIPLLTNVDDLVVDSNARRVFGLYPFDHFLYAVDVEHKTSDIINTAITLRDVLVDEETGRILVSDSANRVRQLDSETLAPVVETRLSGNKADYGFRSSGWAGELALDRPRNRLYVSGLPATVLTADTLAELASLEPGGQLAPDPGGAHIYVSNCGLTLLDAETLSGETLVPGSGPRPDGLSPNPCVGYSQLDPVNRLLYSITPNGTPGSNAGNLLYVYELSLAPRLVFSDTDISIISATPDPDRRRAFVSYIRHGNRRLRILTIEDSQIHYTNQLMGLWGETYYSRGTNRLYVSDRGLNRLLTLEADSLDVIGEMPLPGVDYRLAALDSTHERLYLVDSQGHLLVASTAPGSAPGGGDANLETGMPHTPDGSVLSLVSRGEHILARIGVSLDQYTFEPRLYHTVMTGPTWTDLSQNLPALPIQALAVSPDYERDQTLFSALLKGGQAGGLYKSTDGGQTWAAAMIGLRDLWVDRLFISPDFGQTGLMFADTAYAGLHQSGDGGQSWTPVTPLDPDAPFPAAARNNAAVFSNKSVMISQEIGDKIGIFRASVGTDGAPSRDGVLSEWQQLFDIPVDHLALSPDGQVALGFGNGLWRSPDGGATWEAGGMGLSGIENLQLNQILFSPGFEQDQTMYLFFTDPVATAPSLLFRSTDAGQSWQPWVDPAGAGQIFTGMTLMADGRLLLGDNAAKLTQLAPASLNWATAEATTPFLIEDLAASPHYDTDQTLFAISGQAGLFKSSDGGQSWALTDFPARAYGFSFAQYQLAISPAYAQDQTLYAATGRSLHRSTDGGQSWEQIQRLAADKPGQKFSFQAQQIALSPDFAQDQSLLVSTPTAIYRSTDGGDTWQETLRSPIEGTSTTDILAFAPDGQTSYARFGYGTSLFVSDQGGQTQSWHIKASPTGELFSAISTATASDGALTIAVEFERRLLQTQPQTGSWTDLSPNLPDALVDLSAVASGPGDTLFIGGQGGVFVSPDQGQSWQNVSGNLPPDAPITQLRVSDTQLFAATAHGEIFASGDGGATWLNISIVR